MARQQLAGQSRRAPLELAGGEVGSIALLSDISVVLTSRSLEAVISPLFGIIHRLTSCPSFALFGLILNFSVFDMSMLPFLRNNIRPLDVIKEEIVEHFSTLSVLICRA